MEKDGFAPVFKEVLFTLTVKEASFAPAVEKVPFPLAVDVSLYSRGSFGETSHPMQ